MSIQMSDKFMGKNVYEVNGMIILATKDQMEQLDRAVGAASIQRLQEHISTKDDYYWKEYQFCSDFNHEYFRKYVKEDK